MEPKHLMQLAVILEKGSITAAAEHLLLTQPTLTRNMKTLEMQAGGSLFDRSRFGVRSSRLGENLARQGRSIARQIKVAQESASRHKLGFHSQLRVGVGPLVGMGIMPVLCARLAQLHPDIALTVYSDRPSNLTEQMINGDYDIVISSASQAQIPKGYARHLVVEDQFSVFCAGSHPLATQKAFQAEDLEDCEWVVIGNASPFRNTALKFLEQMGVHRVSAQLATVNDAVILLTVLMQGRHLAVLPRAVTRLIQATYALVELPLATESTMRNLYFWHREEIGEDVAVCNFKKIVQEILTRTE